MAARPNSPSWATEKFWETFSAWLQYKAERRQAYKPMGERACLKRLFRVFRDEDSAIAAIEYSMAQNYQGIFEERKNNPEQPKVGMFNPAKGPGIHKI